MTVITNLVKETKKIRFEGNNYAAEWVTEAEKRGLPNIAATFEALVNQDYHTMPYANATGSDIAAGDVVVVNGVVGVAIGDIDNGTSGTLIILTVLNLVKKQEAIKESAPGGK